MQNKKIIQQEIIPVGTKLKFKKVKPLLINSGFTTLSQVPTQTLLLYRTRTDYNIPGDGAEYYQPGFATLPDTLLKGVVSRHLLAFFFFRVSNPPRLLAYQANMVLPKCLL